jgi:ESS family glutamate:Na+ symporter
MQGVIGYLVISGYDALSGAGVSEWLGAIITHGFTQGPAQALTYGGIWEKEYSIENAAQVGLIVDLARLCDIPVLATVLGGQVHANA